MQKTGLIEIITAIQLQLKTFFFARSYNNSLSNNSLSNQSKI